MTSTIESNPIIIGAFADQQVAEDALTALEHSGFPAEQFSSVSANTTCCRD